MELPEDRSREWVEHLLARARARAAAAGCDLRDLRVEVEEALGERPGGGLGSSAGGSAGG